MSCNKKKKKKFPEKPPLHFHYSLFFPSLATFKRGPPYIYIPVVKKKGNWGTICEKKGNMEDEKRLRERFYIWMVSFPSPGEHWGLS